MTSIAVLGYSNTGKTIFIEHLATVAAETNMQTAILKYGAHPGDFDRSGSDTERFVRRNARIVGYRSDERWMLSIREDTTRPRTNTSGTAKPDTSGNAVPPVEEIPPWMIQLLESSDLLILEGRRLTESYTVLCAGAAISPEELKYAPRTADLVIATDPRLIATLSEFTPNPANGRIPAVIGNPRDAALQCIDVLRQGGKE